MEIPIHRLGNTGTECILRTICEYAAAYPLENAGLIEEILHILLTYVFFSLIRTIHHQSTVLPNQALHCSDKYQIRPFSVILMSKEIANTNKDQQIEWND